MFEEEIFQRIIQAWAADQSHPHRARKQKPLSDIRDLRTIVETAFWASLKREEGRPITFSIALMSKDDIAEEQGFLMSFDHSFPFTVESIAKLAPAFDPKTASLIVAPIDDEKTEYEIWAAMFFNPATDRFEEIPVAIADLNLLRPDVLMVTAITTGSLMITRGYSQIGRFLFGEFIQAVPSPFYSKAMGSYIIDAIKNDDGFRKHQNLYWHVYSDTLDHLLAEVSARGHGGTIVIIPDEKLQQYGSYFSPGYSFKERLDLESLMNRLLVFSKCEDIFKVALKKRYSERVNVLAQFACIDGALIVSSRLEVISFGARLKAPEEWGGEIFVGPTGFGGGGEKFDASKLGTRHKSTIDFVGACPGCIGFVVSQDGPIRGFARKDSDTILCWPDCRVSMFV